MEKVKVIIEWASGSHVIYEKDGKTVSVPFHGSKEMGSGIARRFIREMGLK